MRCRTPIWLVILSAAYLCAASYLDAQDQPADKKAKRGKAADAPAQFAAKKKAPTPVAAMNALIYTAPLNQLIANDDVVRELKLDGKQKEALQKASAAYQEAVSGATGSVQERLKKQQEALQKLNDTLKLTLGDKAKRLDQIAAQGAGLPAFFTPAKAQQLGLTDDQVQKGKAIVDAVYKDMQDKAAKDGTALTAVILRNPQHRTTLIDSATPKLLELLNKNQNARWLDLIGDAVQPELLQKVRTGTNTTGFPGIGGGGFNPPAGGGGKKGGGGFGGPGPGPGPGGFGIPATFAARLAASQRAFTAGNFAEAEDMARKALDLSKEPTVQRGEGLVALAAALCRLNRHADAENPLAEAMGIYEKKVGPLNPRIASVLTWQGICATQRNQLDKAETLHRKALDIHEKVDGPNSIEAAQGFTNLGNVLIQQNKLADAEKLHRRALEIREVTLGKDHPQTAIAIHNLGIVLRQLGKTKEAEEHGLRAVEIYRKSNPNRAELVYPLRMLTDLCIQQKRWPDAEKHARAWLAVLEAGRAHPAQVIQLADENFNRLDVNGDGKLTPNETNAALKENFAKWDKNSDGVIDLREYRDYLASRLAGDLPAPKNADSPALIDPLDRLATILTATDRRDEAAALTKRKDALKNKLASEKK